MTKEAIIQALKDQEKKYRRALDDHDGYEQCKALGSIRLHAARLNTEYEMELPQIHELLFDAGEEYRKEKTGLLQTGRQ